jgi:hypothetical protein
MRSRLSEWLVPLHGYSTFRLVAPPLREARLINIIETGRVNSIS